jgi:hypothetical protein
MAPGNLMTIARNTKLQHFQAALTTPFTYDLLLPQTKYRIWLESQGRLKVNSRPKVYRKIAVEKDLKGLNFAVRIESISARMRRAAALKRYSKN